MFGLDVTVANEATVHIVHCPAGSVEFREDLRFFNWWFLPRTPNKFEDNHGFPVDFPVDPQ